MAQWLSGSVAQWLAASKHVGPNVELLDSRRYDRMFHCNIIKNEQCHSRIGGMNANWATVAVIVLINTA